MTLQSLQCAALLMLLLRLLLPLPRLLSLPLLLLPSPLLLPLLSLLHYCQRHVHPYSTTLTNEDSDDSDGLSVPRTPTLDSAPRTVVYFTTTHRTLAPTLQAHSPLSIMLIPRLPLQSDTPLHCGAVWCLCTLCLT
jgi:hypothetical protein